jgi:hypothetical protein
MAQNERSGDPDVVWQAEDLGSRDAACLEDVTAGHRRVVNDKNRTSIGDQPGAQRFQRPTRVEGDDDGLHLSDLGHGSPQLALDKGSVDPAAANALH